MSGWIALVELLLVFGGLMAFGFWQLHTLKRDRLERDRRKRDDE